MIAALVMTAALGALPACGPLDLDTALALASARSDEVAIKKAEVAAAEADLSLARAARVLPIGSATLVFGPSPAAHGDILRSDSTNRSLANLAPFGRVDLSVVQPIFTWGRLDAASDAATAGVRARTLLVDDTLARVQVRVQQLFWGEAFARRILGIAADVEGALADVNKRMDELMKAHPETIVPSDRYRVQLFQGILLQRKAEAQKGLELAHAGLAATLAADPAAIALVPTPLDLSEGAPPDGAAARAAAERSRPDLLALDQALAARDAEVRAEEGAALPQLFVAGQFTYAYAPNRDIQLNPWVQDAFNQLVLGFVVGLRQDLAFPLLRARASKARAERAGLERQRAGLAQLVAFQADSATSEVRAARDRLLAAKSSLAAGKSLFRSSSLDFAAGVIEARVLLEAYQLYVESQVSMAQAAYDLLVARAQLAQVTGVKPRRGTVECEPH